MPQSHLLPIFVATSGTLLGALLSRLLENSVSKRDIGIWIALAAGMMFGCGAVLTWEAMHLNSTFMGLVSVFSGFILMFVLDFLSGKFLDEETFSFSSLSGKKAVKLFVMVVGLVIHSIGEGISLGLSAADKGILSSGVGIVVYISLALHNIPEAAALALAFRSKGTSKTQAILLTFASTIPQSIVALPAYSVFSANYETLVFGTGVASGCMLYAVVNDIFPEAVAHIGSRGTALAVASLAAAAVIAFDLNNHILIR